MNSSLGVGDGRTTVSTHGPAQVAFDAEKIERAVRMILEAIGEDPDRPGVVDTPRRVAKAYARLLTKKGQQPFLLNSE